VVALQPRRRGRRRWPITSAMPGRAGPRALLAIGDGEQHTRVYLIEWLNRASTLNPRRVPPSTWSRLRHGVADPTSREAYDDLSSRIEFVSRPGRSGLAVTSNSMPVWESSAGMLVSSVDYEPGPTRSRIDHLGPSARMISLCAQLAMPRPGPRGTRASCSPRLEQRRSPDTRVTLLLCRSAPTAHTEFSYSKRWPALMSGDPRTD